LEWDHNCWDLLKKWTFDSSVWILTVVQVYNIDLSYIYNNYKIKTQIEYKLNQQLSYNDAKLKKYLNDNRHLICSDVSSIVSEYDQIIKIYGYVCQFGCLDPSFFILFGLFVYLQVE